MALTAQQLSDIRFDLADVSSNFSADELNDLWDRTDGLSNTTRRLEATKGLAIRALLHNAAKFNDYTAGETQQKKDQIFKHYKDLYNDLYADAVNAALGTTPQTAWAKLRPHPHQTRTAPDA